MREIKFRGKRVDGKGWIYGGYHKNDSGLTFIIIGSYGEKIGHCFIEVIPETVGQYTGLKDKNGKEIYDGDILKGNVYLRFEVEWDSENTGWNIAPHCQSTFEIIGNIHES